MESRLGGQVADFLLEKRRRKSATTHKHYRFVLERIFLPWAESHDLYEASDCTGKILDRLQDDLLGRELTIASVRTYLKGVRVFLAWADVPKGRFEVVPEPQRMRDTLSREEIQRIERAAKTERDAVLVRVLADTGVRISELLGLRLRDLREDSNRRRCFIRVIGKGNKEREVSIPEDTFRRLRKLATQPAADGYVREFIFIGRTGRQLTKDSAEHAVRRMAAAAKIGRRVWPHLFRHTFITQQLRAGKVDLVSLSRHVGHRTLAMITTVYSHVTPDDSHDRILEGLRG